VLGQTLKISTRCGSNYAICGRYPIVSQSKNCQLLISDCYALHVDNCVFGALLLFAADEAVMYKVAFG